jgi:hypothetical protein
MKSHMENRKHKSRSRAMGILALGALSLLAPESRAAKPNAGIPPGVPVLLPPFVGIPTPQPFLQALSPFAVVGFIQSATLDPSCAASDPLCGGTVTVNGVTIIVPRNMILQMPAFAISWADMFRSAPAPYGPTQSGLALSDSPKPFATYEISVQGNRVIDATGDQYRAALITLSQQSLNAGQGYINFIDYAKNEMWVGATLTQKTGARIRINTPSGRYGRPDPLADKRFTTDEDNPTVHADSGYPMCMPRIDPAIGVDSLCPQWNRPRDPFTGAFAQIYTMSAATAGAVGADGITHQVGYPNPPVKPDPFEQAPFEVGDFVNYAGTLVNDVPCVGPASSACQYISAHTLTAAIGIFTAPGAKPAYVVIGGSLLGAGGTPNPLFPQEAVERFFMETFTTDPTQLVDFFALDTNPCTGDGTFRFYATADPFGPPIGALRGRALIRTFLGNFLPASRDMAAATRTQTGGNINAPIPLVANGLAAGYYQAPTFEFIFPENGAVGSPQVPVAFEEFPFLVNGFGPYTPTGFTAASAAQATATVGQLAPWPGPNAPTKSCAITAPLIQPPVPNAGFPQTVTSGSTVTLNGSAVDPNTPAQPVQYTWVQSAGPAVVLSNGTAAHPTFVAPALAPGASPVTLTFQLAVCNGFTCSGISSVNVVVEAATAGPSVTLNISPGQNVLPGTRVTLTGVGVNGTAPLTYTFAQTQNGGLANVTLSGTGNQASFTAPAPPAGTALPVHLAFSVTAKDAGNRTATANIDVFVGADTITVVTVTYRLAKSIVSAAVNTNAPNGAAIITATPMAINNTPMGNSVVLTYDPVANTYNLPPETVNPVPNAVKFTSSFGGTITSPLTLIR